MQDLNTSYASMQSDGQQAADFLKILYPTFQKKRLSTGLVCCDAAGWEEGRERLEGIQEAGYENTLDIVSSHGYNDPLTDPYKTDKKVWQTEWAELNNPWSPVWDNVSAPFEGLVWAQHIQDAFAISNVSAFVNWIGAEYTTGNSPLILIYGDSYIISKRFWAYAQFSKFVFRGARRIDVGISPKQEVVRVSGFQNKDGSVAIQIINTAHVEEEVVIDLRGVRGRSVKSYLTNNQYDLKEASVQISGVSIKASIPARSMMSFVMR